MTRGIRRETAVFLGVQGYGTVVAAEKSEFGFRFSTDGVEKIYAVSDRDAFAVQNLLREGGVFRLTLCGGTVVAAEAVCPTGICGEAEDVLAPDGASRSVRGIPAERIVCRPGGADAVPQGPRPGDWATVCPSRVYWSEPVTPCCPPVCGVPGRRTLKNFLATAMEPVGTTLYVYGGGWNWQDDGAGRAAVSLGPSPCWTSFFQRQDDSYAYRNDGDFSRSWYPHNGWNEYGWAGLDCSGYVGWAVYNLMHDVSGLPGYVQSAAGMAQEFARRGWGTWSREGGAFRPGDLFSMSGHVWICLGACGDGSLVILHSTPSPSRSGAPGGGVQLSAVGEGEDCEAYALASTYMERYFPAWSARYPAVWKPAAVYTAVAQDSRTGRFRWDIPGVLQDPENLSGRTARQILRELFAP